MTKFLLTLAGIAAVIAFIMTVGPHCKTDCPSPEPPWVHRSADR